MHFCIDLFTDLVTILSDKTYTDIILTAKCTCKVCFNFGQFVVSAQLRTEK